VSPEAAAFTARVQATGTLDVCAAAGVADRLAVVRAPAASTRHTKAEVECFISGEHLVNRLWNAGAGARM
jgi:hypothetical protein